MHQRRTSQRGPQKRSRETKNKLIGAAVAAFSATGFDANTVASLEKAADVQRGSAAYHFGSKETLWQAAVDRVFMGYEARMRETFEAELSRWNDDPLSTFIAAYIQTNAEEPDLLNFIVREAKVESDRRYYIADSFVSRFADIISAITGRPKDAHDFYALVGACSFCFVAPAAGQRIFNTEPFSDEFVTAHIRAITDIFRRAWGTGNAVETSQRSKTNALP